MSKRRIACPTFRYEGGKAGLAPKIAEYILKFGRKFIDLFAGRLNITFRAIANGNAFEEWVANDINRAPFFRALRDHGDLFKATPKTQDEFDRLAALAKQGDPHALLMEPFMCFNGGTFEGGGLSTGGGRTSPESFETSIHLGCQFLRSKKVRITQLDWLDCLEAEQPGEHDFVMVDGPYLDSEVGSYASDSICPTELIDYLQRANFSWVFTEHRQPLYLQAFGEPVYQQKAQRPSQNSIQSADQFECIWTNIGGASKRDTVTVPALPVPDDRNDTYYVGLDDDSLIREIKACVSVITESRKQMNKEMRRRLLPALLELKKRTYRKTPGYYEALQAMGLNPDTVRQWFYRSYTADEVIDLMEEKQTEPPPTPHDDGDPLDDDPLDSNAHLLKHADKMARAILDNKVTYAKRLATQFVRVREENRE